MSLVCWIWGHKFVYIPAYGSTHYSDFCLRCGTRATEPDQGRG